MKAAESVILWEKEKTRILKDHQLMIDKLNDKVKELETQRDNYKKKLAEQLDDLKTEKLKADISRRRSTAHLTPGKFYLSYYKAEVKYPNAE